MRTLAGAAEVILRETKSFSLFLFSVICCLTIVLHKFLPRNSEAVLNADSNLQEKKIILKKNRQEIMYGIINSELNNAEQELILLKPKTRIRI